MRSRLARFGTCEQHMPIPVFLKAFKPTIPVPLYPLALPFNPLQESETPPKIVPIEIGEYPTKCPVLPGQILANASGFLPPGYLVCNGLEVSRTTYPELFRLIGTYYGDGDGVTTFNLPNLTNDATPTAIYIIKYDLFSDTIPSYPPPCNGDSLPVPPTVIDLQMLSYPLDYIPAPGSILFNRTSSLPDGYLACDGSTVSRNTYAILYNMIGTYYGEGDGSTTFNLPHLSNGDSPTYQYIIRYADTSVGVTGTPVVCVTEPVHCTPIYYGNGCGGAPVVQGPPPPPSRTNVQILPYPLAYIPSAGTILMNTTNSLPDGYLSCDGAAVSRTTYSLLFNIIGLYYGAGDGSTTFSLPHLSQNPVYPYQYIIRYQNPVDGIIPNPAMQIPVFPTAYIPSPGTILRNTETYLPSGYVACDGSAVSRTEYSVLFSAIDTFYGVGDGSTTFNLPALSNGTGNPNFYIIRYVEQIIPCVTITPNLNVAGVGISGTESFNFT